MNEASPKACVSVQRFPGPWPRPEAGLRQFNLQTLGHLMGDVPKFCLKRGAIPPLVFLSHLTKSLVLVPSSLNVCCMICNTVS